jgi:hypothetical protein
MFWRALNCLVMAKTQLQSAGLLTDTQKMERYAEEMHQQVLDLIETLSITSTSDTDSSVRILMFPRVPEITTS